MTDSKPAPGWYPTPKDPHVLRWWDGEQWTDNTHRLTDNEAVDGDPAGDQFSEPPVGIYESHLTVVDRVRGIPRSIFVVGLAAVAIVAVAVFLLGSGSSGGKKSAKATPVSTTEVQELVKPSKTAGTSDTTGDEAVPSDQPTITADDAKLNIKYAYDKMEACGGEHGGVFTECSSATSDIPGVTAAVGAEDSYTLITTSDDGISFNLSRSATSVEKNCTIDRKVCPKGTW